VAKRALPVGAKIQKEDFAFQKQDVTFSREVAPQEQELLGSETAQYIMANQPFWKSSLKRRLALMRGAPVDVVLGDKTWSIHFSGIAQDNGYIGDIAKVLNPGTKKIITGMIIDENTVEVR
jgi:flagella basal body P-ring formation protein FlgA